MKDQTAYTRIAKKIDEQDPHTAPRAEDGNISEAFIKHLELVYSPEEAEIVQHLNALDAFTPSQEVAEACGKDLEVYRGGLARVRQKAASSGFSNMYCLPVIPMLLNAHNFYPEIRPGDIEAAHLYKEYFIESGFYKNYETVKEGTPVRPRDSDRPDHRGEPESPGRGRGPRIHPEPRGRRIGPGPLPLPHPNREAGNPRVQGQISHRVLHLYRRCRPYFRDKRPGQAGDQTAGNRLPGRNGRARYGEPHEQYPCR